MRLRWWQYAAGVCAAFSILLGVGLVASLFMLLISRGAEWFVLTLLAHRLFAWVVVGVLGVFLAMVIWKIGVLMAEDWYAR